MKVTLIYVGIGIAGFNVNRPKGDREGSWIGHGVASVGAAVKSAGYDVNLIDLRKLSGWQQFIDIIKESPADVYGLSVSAVDYNAALKAMLEIKLNVPQSYIIVGGIHPSIFPHMYQFGIVDTVVTGEGEITFVDLLAMIEFGEMLPHVIQGIKPDLNNIPWVDRNLFDYQRELDCNFAHDQILPAVTMLAGRGCPYKCAYCQPAENVVFGKPYRLRSAQNVISELLVLKDRYNFNSVTFWDDTFTFKSDWVKQFCNMYIDSGLTAKMTICSRADIICNDEDMVSRLATTGVEWIIIGLESGSQRLLDFIQKGTTIEQNFEAVRLCKKYGIKVFGTHMYGLPTETKEEASATLKMVTDMNIEVASPFWYVPIPGTKLHQYCDENNLLLDDVKSRTVERTGKYLPSIKGVDYKHLTAIMQGYS